MARHGKGIVNVDPDRCKGMEGCGLCQLVCPEDTLGTAPRMNPRGVHPVQVVALERCTGCGLCVLHCPDLALWLETRAAAA